jgi:hypothetical protein
MAWKEARERQQLTFPIDTQSERILNENVLTTDGIEVIPSGILVDDTALKVEVGGVTYYLLASPTP